ncbi:MAG: hypothetical protein CM15mV88_110 [Caudoviricetes sp.]|nr:MAG: hypothetical protein CM15mV88_110 [Caudoviricetes sp.]
MGAICLFITMQLMETFRFKVMMAPGGTTEYFRLNGDNTDIVFSKPIGFEDNVELRIGE